MASRTSSGSRITCKYIQAESDVPVGQKQPAGTSRAASTYALFDLLAEIGRNIFQRGGSRERQVERPLLADHPRIEEFVILLAASRSASHIQSKTASVSSLFVGCLQVDQSRFQPCLPIDSDRIKRMRTRAKVDEIGR